MLPVIVATSWALSILLIFIGLALRPTSDQVQARLTQYGTRPRTLEEMELAQPFSERIVKPMIKQMSSLMTRFAPQRNVEMLRRRLEMAGNPNNWTPADFLGVRGLAALVAAGLALFLLLVIKFPLLRIAAFTIGGGVLGYYLPNFWLTQQIKARQNEIVKTMPDALDLLTISVEAGLGFDAAISKVTEKWDNELSRAFARVIREVRIGKPRREALRDMAARIDVPDMTNFVAAIVQAEQLGVSISKVLRIQSEQMRLKRRQRAEEKAQQAPLKMSVVMVLLIFPSIWVISLGPAILNFVSGGGFGG